MCFVCVHCMYFFIVGVQVQRATHKRRIMYIMYSLVLWWVAGAVFLVVEILLWHWVNNGLCGLKDVWCRGVFVGVLFFDVI